MTACIASARSNDLEACAQLKKKRDSAIALRAEILTQSGPAQSLEPMLDPGASRFVYMPREKRLEKQASQFKNDFHKRIYTSVRNYLIKNFNAGIVPGSGRLNATIPIKVNLFIEGQSGPILYIIELYLSLNSNGILNILTGSAMPKAGKRVNLQMHPIERSRPIDKSDLFFLSSNGQICPHISIHPTRESTHPLSKFNRELHFIFYDHYHTKGQRDLSIDYKNGSFTVFDVNPLLGMTLSKPNMSMRSHINYRYLNNIYIMDILMRLISNALNFPHGRKNRGPEPTQELLVAWNGLNRKRSNAKLKNNLNN